jgi:channel protein (hemolysin III family)
MNVTYALPWFAQPVSSWTHLAGAVVFACLGVLLLRRSSGSVGRIIAMCVFVCSCVLLLSISGVYHSLAPNGMPHRVFGRLDHAAIFLLIAGSFTAIHTVAFTGFGRWGVITMVWVGTVAIITIKTAFFDSIGELSGLMMYLGFSWTGILSGIALWRRYGFGFIQPMVYGGLAYTLGAVLEILRMPVLIEGVVGPHEVFHVAVLIGISCHWWFVHRELQPHAAASEPRLANASSSVPGAAVESLR